MTLVPRACAGSLVAPYRHAWLPLLPTEPVGARTALGTAERKQWEAGPGWSPTRQGQAPRHLPALLSHQGCQACHVHRALTVQGGLSPPAKDTCSASGCWSVSALPSTREVLLSPRLHPRDARAGGDGDGSSPTPGQAGFQIPPLRLHPLGRGTQGRNPKPVSWQGRTELGRDSRCHPPLTHEGDWALPSSAPEGNSHLW